MWSSSVLPMCVCSFLRTKIWLKLYLGSQCKLRASMTSCGDWVQHLSCKIQNIQRGNAYFCFRVEEIFKTLCALFFPITYILRITI